MRIRGTAEELEARRRRAVRLLQKGNNLVAVARAVGCSVSSVHRWQKAYLQEGEKGLVVKSNPGRPRRLSKAQERQLRKLLRKWFEALEQRVENPELGGYLPDYFITTKRVTKTLEQYFGVTYHPNHLWRVLRRLGWRRVEIEGWHPMERDG